MNTDERRLLSPTYEQLLAAPELASLALLESALDVASLALAAAWPELHDADVHERDDDEPLAALEILERAATLVAAIHRYRRVLVAAGTARDDLPF
jgi:hypothetical protein